MRTTRRTALAGGITASALLLAACASGEEEAQDPGPGTDGGTVTSAPERPEEDTSPEDGMAGDGVTTAADVYGPGCDQVPTDPEDPGSVEGMIDDPVGTAASNNPLLTNLTAAVEAAGLGDTLNDTGASYTVFAPADPAFEAIREDELTALLTDPDRADDLTGVLTYHVVPERLDADGVAEWGTLDTVQGGQLTVEGSGEDLTVNGASVLCGNIPTANATVFVVDEVLMPQE
ncbi:fasciclin domain-containing protein [Actinoalloteichus caeruleus]|uniref:Uncaracterized surface protein containing fasciclin (FAS1) repeats n=1 Tax=Actinoalloteichus caeruleus DSM 43889 TaxID=1120930 RepID=A0ABT1JCH6_ACTCY|nr:fasciclin domain-containing protein [Actinoalloteichus caeruleus]MCP2330187.1 Uncaracterized surface protein containing fasciclin (FAS1) repeats [Actinoalloteichus caeruleus DSM 43889]